MFREDAGADIWLDGVDVRVNAGVDVLLMGWMFYQIDHPRTPSFPTGLVKTESNFIVWSVETGRWTLMIAVLSVDAYPLWLSQTWHVALRLQE